jgi:hypothetical protein
VPTVPPPSDEVEMASAIGALPIAMLNALADASLAASSTCAVNDAVPAAVGAPEITPVEAARLKPVGSEPETMLQLYGVVPPLACSVAEYAVPSVPPASAEVEIAGTEASATARLSALVPELFAASVTRIVGENAPTVFGTPEITPVEAARLSPVGRLPDATLQV